MTDLNRMHVAQSRSNLKRAIAIGDEAGIDAAITDLIQVTRAVELEPIIALIDRVEVGMRAGGDGEMVDRARAVLEP